MGNFRWIAVIGSLILGLGAARLLISAVSIFHARRMTLDWLPLVWAATTFLRSVAFWWSLEEAASRVTAWTLRHQPAACGRVARRIPGPAAHSSRGIRGVPAHHHLGRGAADALASSQAY